MPRLRPAIRPFAAALAALLALAGVARAEFPAHVGAVVDQAHIIDSTTAGWVQRTAAALAGKTGDEIVVASVASLDGMDIDSYATALGRALQLGQPGKANGVIILIAPVAGQVALQVGDGLRQTIPDSLIGAVLANRVIPALAAGDIGGGIHDGVETLRVILTAAFEDRHRDDPQQPVTVQRSHEDQVFLNGLMVFIGFCLMLAAIGVLGMLGVIPDKRRGWWRLLDPIIWLAGAISVSGGHGDDRTTSSSGGFSGGGGSFGGGGSSGSW